MKKKFIKFFTFLMLVLGLASCAQVEGIEITSANNVRTIKEGETLQLEAKVYPEGANQKVEWTSTDSSIATVNEDGLVSAILEGRVSIVATSVANKDVSQEFALIIEEKEPEVVVPTSIEISSHDNLTTVYTGEKLTLSYKLLPEGANQRVLWLSSDSKIATVSNGIVKGVAEGKVTIIAKVEGYDNVFDSITLDVIRPTGPTPTKDWANMAYSTHDDYVTSAEGEPLKVKGVVTHVCPGDGVVSYFIQDGKTGYYVYQQDATYFNVELGKSYEVGGFKEYYNGLNEIANVEHFVELSEPCTYEVNNMEGIDITSLDAMKVYQGSKVTGEAVFDSVEVNTKAYNFYGLVDGKSATFRVDPTYMSAEDFNTISTMLADKVAGTKFTYTGFVTAFGYGTPKVQIQIGKPSDLVFGTVTAEDILNAAITEVSVASYVPYSLNNIDLMSSIDGFADVTVSWSSDNAAINTTTGVVTHKDTDLTVKLTVTLSTGGKEVSKTFDVLVEKESNETYETVASLDLEDAEPGTKETYFNSPTKNGYKEGVVSLGTPKVNWLLRNALITATSSDHFDGILGIRAQAKDSVSETGRIEIQEDGEYNVVDFSAAIYGNDAAGIQIRIEYSFDSGATWTAANKIITVTERELTQYRVELPEGVKRVAIVIVEGSGRRVNIDNIKLMK